ncbi:MAG TPA: COR domain-containing protein, partial [Anaerolineales bacterium]|nr:COR domain-containing protein [Anaerolineales bacterium]
LAPLDCFDQIHYLNNPFNLELDAAHKEGRDAVRRYLGSKAREQIILNEAKLIIIGEGEVGKSCLLDALRGDPWEEGRPTTHGIEIKSVKVTDPDSKMVITLNGWDFGGQRVYRPTHQLFFSAPAVYLVVWKPREGPQQGFVKEWIQLVKRREPDAKILVVATHGGPQQRQPDIDRQELWDVAGRETVIDFFHVESKPDENRVRRGIEALKHSIARVASTLPEVGRSVPKRWQEVRETLAGTQVAYLPLERVLELCRIHQMDDEEARLFVIIEHRLGHLIHYQHDPTLRDIVVLKPNWLATAISFVLDDEATRNAHGLVRFSRLSQLWDNPARTAEFRYLANLHPIFLRLMERFDLSYRVANPSSKGDSDTQSLIAQLVPDATPEKDLDSVWSPEVTSGDIQQMQICRIVDEKGQTAAAEGLFYQLIVRLHKYSLGREDYIKSIHWQRGLVLDDEYNGRALLRHVGNDVHITVRAPYPERFLAMLTEEVKYLVESFWEGLRCDVMVPCLNPNPCIGLFEVRKLIENKRRGRPEQPCPVCNDWQDIDQLLRNAPAAQPDVTALIFAEFAEVKAELAMVRQKMSYQGDKIMGRFDRLDDRTRRTLSRVDKTYIDLLQVFTDEAKEGPRLFSLVPIDRSNFNPREWIKSKFRLTLWCEHSRLPLSGLNGKDNKKGIYEIELTREWFKRAGPYLKLLAGTLSLVLPVASSAVKLALDKAAYEAIEEQLDFGRSIIDATIGEGKVIEELMGAADTTTLEHSEVIRAQGATLRELHVLLKAKDPGFGGLVRVMNKRQEFLWVHERFAGEY